MRVTLWDIKKGNSPFVNLIGREQTLYWPVAVYRVTLPCRVVGGMGQRTGQNPFESVILRLLPLVSSLERPKDCSGLMELATEIEQKLAYATCLPLDLVKVIMLRLQDRGFVNEYGGLQQTDTAIEASGESEPEGCNYDVALVVRELCGGQMLPYLHVSQLRRDEKELPPHGKAWLLPGMPPPGKPDSHEPPTPEEVIRIAKAMARRRSGESSVPHVSLNRSVKVKAEPEYYYLDCRLGIQRGQEELRIADPFVDGFSLVLEQSFRRLLERDNKLGEHYQAWRRNLSVRPMGRQESPAAEYWKKLSCYDQYPQLVQQLIPAHNQQYRNIMRIYSSLEWALYYYCASREDTTLALESIRQTNPADHNAMLLKKAKEYGFETEREHSEGEQPESLTLQGVRPGKLLDFRDGKAELPTVLAIALLLDSRRNDVSGLRRVAQRHPNALWRIFELKRRRDESSHGATDMGTKGDKELESDAFMRDVVHELLPSVVFPETPVEGMSQEERSNKRLDAITRLQGILGYAVYNKLTENTRNFLIMAEQAYDACSADEQKHPDASLFIHNVYSAMQSLLKPVLKERMTLDTQRDNYFQEADAKAQKAGFPPLPEHLKHVKPAMMEETLRGHDKTLGACLLALLILSAEEELSGLCQADDQLVEAIATIVALRGHGNEDVPLERRRLDEIRKMSYKAVETIVEM